jgi:hypothetical protein
VLNAKLAGNNTPGKKSVFPAKSGKNSTYFEFLKRNYAYDEYLVETMGFVFDTPGDSLTDTDRDSNIDNFQKLCQKVITSITKDKSSEILKEEHDVYNLGLPLIVGNEDKPIFGNQTNSSNFMGQIDKFINKNVEYEYFRYISPHIIFNFCHNLLKKLEADFNDISIVANNNRDSNHKLIQGVNSILGTSIQNPDELAAFFTFLDKTSISCVSLMNHFKTKLHFSEDLMLNKTLDIYANDFKRGQKMMDNKKKLVEYLELLESEKYSNLKEHKRRYGNTKANQLDDNENAMKMTLDHLPSGDGKMDFSDKYHESLWKNVMGAVGGDTLSRKTLNPSWLGMFMELDVRTKRVIEGDESGFDDAMTHALEWDQKFTDSFEMFDIR